MNRLIDSTKKHKVAETLFNFVDLENIVLLLWNYLCLVFTPNKVRFESSFPIFLLPELSAPFHSVFLLILAERSRPWEFAPANLKPLKLFATS